MKIATITSFPQIFANEIESTNPAKKWKKSLLSENTSGPKT